MNISCIRVEFQLRLRRRRREIITFRRGHYIYRTEVFRFFDRLGRPLPGINVVSGALTAQQVHRHHGELAAGTTLHKENFVVIRNKH